MSSRPIVAIDGPAGSGKSTVAKLLALRLGYVYIDTGAMYRAIALLARRQGIEWSDAEGLSRLAEQTELELRPEAERTRVLAGGEEITSEIRTPEISRGSSAVSQIPGVREALVAQQRRMAADGGVVMEGRDIGTVVFPNAELKVFLTATVGERARRRAAELQARGEPVYREEVEADVASRDRRDSEREHSPLRKAEDAVELYTDGLTIDEVVDRLEELARERERP